METRPVFIPALEPPFYTEFLQSFSPEIGKDFAQKQKNVQTLHDAFLTQFPNKKILEISTKSTKNEGVALSAFNLLLNGIAVEKEYQAAKVFQYGGPYSDMRQNPSSKAVKKDPRLVNSGHLLGYYYDGRAFAHDSLFYDWLYIRALLQNPEAATPLLRYNAFTDIEFDRNGRNCQARTAAMFVSLTDQGLLDQVEDYDQFYALVRPSCN